VDVQAIAGAVGTGTHGTGPSMGNISSNVTGARIVRGDGEIVEITEASAGELLAARVALGSLGIFTQVELQLVPAYRLEERTWRARPGECMADLDRTIAATRHFEFFWFPQSDVCEMKSLHPTDDPNDILEVREGGGDVSVPLDRRCGWSHQIIPSVRNFKFHEMEYAVPSGAGPACFAQVRERIRSRWPDVAWPVEYRTLRADPAYLSPAHGRETVTISIHQDARLPYREFFEDIEPIFTAHAGRPHWGKVNTRTAEQLADLYPRWDDFRQVRDHFDPAGTFLNDYLRGLFAP
jgi:FAD/FMN-containing dehydrogenase